MKALEVGLPHSVYTVCGGMPDTLYTNISDIFVVRTGVQNNYVAKY